MTAVSTLPAGFVVTCPMWCEIDEHKPGDVQVLWGDSDDIFVVIDHQGPRFGHFRVSAREYLGSDRCVPFVDFEAKPEGERHIDDVDAEQLRKHAADALAAAEWIESVTTR